MHKDVFHDGLNNFDINRSAVLADLSCRVAGVEFV